jgi:hypothetical protein
MNSLQQNEHLFNFSKNHLLVIKNTYNTRFIKIYEIEGSYKHPILGKICVMLKNRFNCFLMNFFLIFLY